MKKLTPKLFILVIITLILSFFVPRLVMVVFNIEQSDDISITRALTFSIIYFGTVFSIFSIIINNGIIRRIKLLDTAMTEVRKGNYDHKITMRGKDEISSLSDTYNLMIEELDSNEYLNKEFVRNFSHEIKTPLSAIKGYAELLEDENLSVEAKKYLEIIINESSRLSSLSTNMLQISLIDSKHIIPKNDRYDLSKQIRDILLVTQLQWDNKNITLDLKLDKAVLTTNKELMHQVLLNIINNAIKFSNEDETIVVTSNIIDDVYRCSVINKGDILTEEDINKVFDLFYIKDKSRNKCSSGVGLTLTKKIIEKLDGTISFESKDGITTVTVEVIL